MRHFAQMVAALLLCLMAGQPLAAAWIASASPEMACCRKGKGAHACCKRKAMGTAGPALAASSQCGTDCCCKLAPLTEKPFQAGAVSLLVGPAPLALVVVDEGSGELSSNFDRTQWQRPPPTRSWY